MSSPPTIWDRVANAARSVFGYHVVDTSRNRRQIPAANLKTEDKTLTKNKRERLIETARDANRNFAVTAWCVRKHLDFVTSHHFHCRAKDRGLRDDIEAYIAERMKPDAFDRRGRHHMDRWMRILEARAVLDGDIFGIRLSDGTMQAAEGIYCRNPKREVHGYKREQWEHGVYLDEAGKAKAYCFATRPQLDQSIDQIVSRDKVVHHGYFDRFDQARGVGLVTPGLANAVDLYETLDYAVAKAKVAQLFALAIYRQGETAPAPVTNVQQGAGQTTNPEAPKSQHEIDFGKGPAFLDLEPGERAEFLHNQSPGIDPEFLRTLCILTLSALDLPYCWLDASDANFFGNRGALILYLASCKQKRKSIVTVRNDWTDWQLERAFANGDLLRPSQPIPFKWQAEGVPFWNPAQEVSAHVTAIENVLDTRQRVVEETHGVDWEDLLEQAQYEHEQLVERGLLPATAKAPGLQPTDEDLNAKRDRKRAKTSNGNTLPRFMLSP